MNSRVVNICGLPELSVCFIQSTLSQKVVVRCRCSCIICPCWLGYMKAAKWHIFDWRCVRGDQLWSVATPSDPAGERL